MTDFSVKKAVLYRAGIGWFSADGEVNDDTIYFPVPSNSLDDFLKTSLVGIKGGKTSVKNLSFETMGHHKSLFSTSLILTGMINFLRGSMVKIILEGREEIGKLMGYQEMNTDKEMILKVSLLDEKGVVKQLDGMQIDEITPLSEKDQSKLGEFLQSLANESDEEHQTLLKIQLNDTGEFTVRVSFLTNVPAWKLAYRLVNQDAEKFRLETFGIVDNNTLVDWVDANLVLSTKTPVSFKYDLSTPHIINRPVISRTSDTGIDVPDLAPMAAPPPGGGMMNRSMQVQDIAGEVSYAQEEMDYFGTEYEEQASIEPGESIEYRLIQPVTIKRKQSSMVPLSTNEIEGVKKMYYNSSNHRIHPFYVIEFTNNLQHALDNGPITVYSDDNEFWGEAMLPRIGKNEDYLITYALNKNLIVKTDTTSRTFLEKIQIKGLSKIEISSQIRKHTFEMDNRDDDPADLYLAIGKDQYKPLKKALHGYKPNKDFTEVSDEYRVVTSCPGVSKSKVVFTMINEYRRSEYLYYLDQKTLKKLLEDESLSEKEKEIVLEIYNILMKLQEVKKKRETLNQRYSRIKERREQIINTLKVLDKDSEDKTRKKYITEIENIDTDIDKIMKKIEKFDKEIVELEKNQTDYKHLQNVIKSKK